MRWFGKKQGLCRLPVESRLLYSGFCLFMVLGYATAVWIYVDDKLGASKAAAARYYLGESRETGADDAASWAAGDAGPELVMPEDVVATPLHVAKPARQVMETFHFHLFTMPLVLLVVAHLFLMCGLPAGLKITVLLAALTGTGAHLFAPVLIRFASPQFAALMFPSAVLMGLSWTMMTGWPVFEMWARPLTQVAQRLRRTRHASSYEHRNPAPEA